MKPWKSIVVGVDFSDSSRSALREAARLAHWHKCHLHVAHAIAMAKHYESPPESSTAISLMRDQVEEKLKALCLEEVEFLGDIEYHILVGHPFREVCQLTHDINADLLVLGSCDQDGKLQRAGTIAAKCIRKAPVPVLLVRATHDNPYENILVGIDFSDTSMKAVDLAAEIAFENHSRLHLVHVHEPLLKLSDYPFCPPEGENTATQERVQHQLEAKLQECKTKILSRFKDLPITTHFIHTRKVSDALISFIQGNRVSLVVLGTRGRTGLRSLLMGTTAERLIHECPCSILAVKPHDFAYPL